MTPAKVALWVAVASGPVALLLWWGAGAFPTVVESFYSRGLYPALMAPWSRFTASLPFALTPVLLGLLIVGGVVAFVVWPWPRALAVCGAGVSVLLAWFVVGWGLNVQRPSWGEAHRLTVRGGTVAELAQLATRLADGAAALRAQAGADPGWQSDARAVQAAYERAGAADPLLAGRWGAPKAFPSAELLSWLGIAGIFLPHTGEPTVNLGSPAWQRPAIVAHESAHLHGFCREDEANFLAFWVLKDDPDARLAYSVWSQALLQVAQALAEAGPPGETAWAKVALRLDPGIRADWDELFAYWKRFEGPAREVSQAVNDAYLKSQGQSDGVKSYGRMVDLLLATEAAWGTSPAPRKN